MAGNIIQQEITEYYSGYMAMSMARLALWTFLITLYLFSMGVFLYFFLSKATVTHTNGITQHYLGLPHLNHFALQFLKALYFIPSSIVASFHYRISRLYPLLDSISVSVPKCTQTAMIFIAVALVTYTIIKFTNATIGNI